VVWLAVGIDFPSVKRAALHLVPEDFKRGIDLGEMRRSTRIILVGVRVQPLCQLSKRFFYVVCSRRSRHRQGLIGVAHARTPTTPPNPQPVETDKRQRHSPNSEPLPNPG
jgi:hypothetical protein